MDHMNVWSVSRVGATGGNEWTLHMQPDYHVLAFNLRYAIHENDVMESIRERQIQRERRSSLD